MVIDRFRYPWLHIVSQGAVWLGTDEFQHLVAVGGGELWETWLDFVAVNGGWGQYEPRLKGPKDQCAIAVNEIAVAQCFATKCRMAILQWQPPGAGRTRGEFLMG